MENIRWTSHVEKEVLTRVKEQTKILRAIKQRHANSNGHILCRNCFLKYITERKIEGKRRRGRRYKQLLNDFKEERRY
jgi:predicted nucleotidyltransferase